MADTIKLLRDMRLVKQREAITAKHAAFTNGEAAAARAIQAQADALGAAIRALQSSDEPSSGEAPEHDDPVVGHKTFRVGDTFRHEPLRKSEADVLLRQIEERDARRRELMPTEKSAIDMMMEAWIRLKELGWNEAVYCPKDGSTFEVIEPGSTGIFKCHYEGKWPDGSWWLHDDGDMCSSRPILFRALAAANGERGK